MGERLESLAQQLRRNDIPISRLELSARAYNALKLNGMNYLSEFVTKDLEELKRLDFVTAGVAEELYACVREHRFLVTRGFMIEKEPEAPAVQPENAIVMSVQQEILAPAAATHIEPAEPLHSGEPANEPKADAILETLTEPEAPTEETVENDGLLAINQLQEETSELDDDRPIAVLNLSVRSYNCLMRAKIDTIRKLSKQTPEDLAKIRNMGKKSIDEITAAIISLMSGRLAAEVESPEGEAESAFIDTRPIQELSLSKSATDGLLSANITTVQNLLDCPTEALNKIRRLSKRDINEILYILRFLHGDVPDDGQGSPREEIGDRIPMPAETSIESLNLSVRSTNCLKRAKIYTLKQLLECTPDELLKIRNLGQQSLQELKAVRDKYAAVSEDSINIKYTAEALKALIIGVFKKPFAGLSYQEIKDSLPDTLDDAAIKHVIGELIAEKELEYVDFRCYRKYPSYFEYLETYLATRPEREQEMVRRRYSGETLEAIAKDLGITRERVRQIQARTDRKLHMSITAVGAFDEDFYETLYTKCYLPESFWSDELNLSRESINYLKATYKCGTEDPENLLNDNEIPISLRYRVRSYLDRDKVQIDGLLIPRKRSELEEYALRKFAQDELTFEQFTELYNGMLEESGVPFSEKLYYTDGVIRTRVNRFADSMLCLWKQGERLRFYDIPAKDLHGII